MTRNDSHLANPVYGTPPMNTQHMTRQEHHSETNNDNLYQIEDDRDYHMLEDPPQSEGSNPVSMQHRGLVVNYEGFREDSVSVESYEAPVSQGQQEDGTKKCQDSEVDERV